jgi:hypothetical protein
MRLNTLNRHLNSEMNPFIEFVRLVDFISEATPLASITDAAVNVARMERRLGGAQLPEAVYGATEAGERLDAFSRKLEEQFGATLIAMSVWGRAKSSKGHKVHTDYKIGALCEDDKGRRRVFVARTELPMGWGSSGESEIHVAAWAIENEISWVKRDGKWSWVSSMPEAQTKIVVEHQYHYVSSGYHGVREGESYLVGTLDRGLEAWRETRERRGELAKKAALAFGGIFKSPAELTREGRLDTLLPDEAREAGADFEREELVMLGIPPTIDLAERDRIRECIRRDALIEGGLSGEGAAADAEAAKPKNPRR